VIHRLEGFCLCHSCKDLNIRGDNCEAAEDGRVKGARRVNGRFGGAWMRIVDNVELKFEGVAWGETKYIFQDDAHYKLCPCLHHPYR
jgi:hypothetical protein